MRNFNKDISIANDQLYNIDTNENIFIIIFTFYSFNDRDKYHNPIKSIHDCKNEIEIAILI